MHEAETYLVITKINTEWAIKTGTSDYAVYTARVHV